MVGGSSMSTTPNLTPCPQCHGTGKQNGQECEVCFGSGEQPTPGAINVGASIVPTATCEPKRAEGTNRASRPLEH